MAKPKEIRVPRTTALFVTGLARILREHFHMRITEHECWTFEQIAGWEECSARGQCNFHGFSDEFVARMERDHPDQMQFMDSWSYTCDAYEISVYLGTGRAEVDDRKVDFRVRIEETEHCHFGHCYEVLIWVRNEAGEVRRGIFGLMDDGDPYVIDKPIDKHPPRKIAFWRDATPVGEHPMDN